jgi:hypothetical protein
MPTPARFRTACVARLWDETRYADARARARMLADAEAFVRDVDAAAEYPEELVIARVTRYRPEHATVGAVVPGRALLHDLTAFVLRLSRRDPLDAASRGGAMPAAAAARALGVAARTLARFRSSGLVMHHVRDASGRVRTACFPDALDAFRARSAGRVERAARTRRLDDAAREALAMRAVEACARGGRQTLNSLAVRLAPTVGCSVRSARSALERDARVVQALRAAQRGAVRPNRSAPAIRRLAARAHAFGFAPRRVARHVGVTEAAAARAMLRGRVDALRTALSPVRAERLAAFVRPGAEASILAPAAVRNGLAVGPVRLPEPTSARGSRGRDPVDAALVTAFRFLEWRAVSALRAMPREPSGSEVDRVEQDLRWAHRLKRALVERALPAALVPCAQRLGRSWDQVPAPLRMRWTAFAASEAGRALEFGGLSQVAIAAVRPSQLAAHAVERAIARGGPEFAPPAGEGAGALDDAVRRCVPWWHAVCAGDGWAAIVDRRAPDARTVVLRFGLDGAPPRTFDEMARELRTSASLAAAAWYRAMRGG